MNAELTKIAVNTYVTTKISYANMLAEMCERLPGGDVDVVTDAVGLDSRIGRKYLRGALGYGGPCFPRDNKAFAGSRDIGADPALAEATDAINVASRTALGSSGSRLPARIRRRARALLQAGHRRSSRRARASALAEFWSGRLRRHRLRPGRG